MTSNWVKRFVFSLPVNRLFVTREVLHCGSRSAVDQALSRLVRLGAIQRIARGVFARAGSRMFTVLEVATAKAKAFAKTLSKHPSTIAFELGLTTEEVNGPIFSTSGCTSRFLFDEQMIEMKQYAPRKRFLGESKAGEAIKALWRMGNGGTTFRHVAIATKSFQRQDRKEFMGLRPWMPAWLNTTVLIGQRTALSSD